HPGAQIDSSVEIGPWCIVGPKVKMGKGNRLISHVVIDGRTTIGEGNTFFPFAAIGMIPQDLKYKGEDTELIIGNNNSIRESVTLNLGTVQGGGKTAIGDHNLLMAYTHLGHDCIIGSHCIIANSGGLAGHCIIEDYVTMGGMCGVAPFVRIGAHAYIAGFSGVEKDIPPFAIAIGQRPCAIKGTNIVGLRRRGIPAETISVINESIKLWVRGDVEKERCLLEIESQYGDVPEVARFVSFIRSSQYGTAR
ncbi:acyl-ACP--UDP-N-acetylglucosamine O-acyltransferase, partial [bacterium]|nr:acyl-ACP--UDP-N-acetylglucosamine O-acyltransferase [bacterium]